jgi:predicted house-cleaning noncanonical NTP pyrophosphatase (MazG superfamily)
MAFQHIITDLPAENEYPKLVRDRIPEIIVKADGRKVPVRALGLEEFIDYLKKKVVEEAKELEVTKSDSHLLEEIADLREVLEALEVAKGFTSEQVKTAQDAKRAKRGGFDLRLLMLNND